MIFRKKIKTKWHKWEKIPETKIIYLNEEKWWNDFIPWVIREHAKNANWLFMIKVKYFLRGWTGWDSNDNRVIWIRESKYCPKLLHHEMGHLIQRQHTPWSPGLMHPIFLFRWFT